MKKMLFPLAITLLLTSCGTDASSSVSSQSSSNKPAIDETPLSLFFENLKTNRAKVATSIKEEGMKDFESYVTFDYYGDKMAYQTNGKYIQDIYFAQTGQYLPDDGIMVHGEQGLFHYGLNNEGFLQLGEPISFGTSLTDAGISLPSLLADRSFYALGSDNLHYTSVIENNLPIASDTWFAVMGVTLDEATFATNMSFVLNEEGTEMSATIDLLTQEGGLPVTSTLRANLTFVGTNEPPELVRKYLEDLPVIMTPSTWGGIAASYFFATPGNTNVVFPKDATVQYGEVEQFNMLQVSIDGVNLSRTYPEALKADGFVPRTLIQNGTAKTVFRREVKGEAADSFHQSILDVEIQISGTTSYLVFTRDVTYKGVAEFNHQLEKWNDSEINKPESLGGMELGLEIVPLDQGLENGLLSFKFEDITELLTYLYLQNGINPYLLKSYEATLSYATGEEALKAANLINTAYLASSFVDLGKSTLDKDGRIGLKKAKDANSYGVGLDLTLGKNQDNQLDGTVNLLYYVAPSPYVDAFVTAK